MAALQSAHPWDTWAETTPAPQPELPTRKLQSEASPPYDTGWLGIRGLTFLLQRPAITTMRDMGLVRTC